MFFYVERNIALIISFYFFKFQFIHLRNYTDIKLKNFAL